MSFVKGVGTFCWASMDILIVRFAQDVFTIGEGGAMSLSILMASSGLGIFILPLVVSVAVKDTPRNSKLIVMTGFFLTASGSIAMSWCKNFPVFCVLYMFRAGGAGFIWVYSAIILQRGVPPEIMGRVFSFEVLFLTLTNMSIYLVTGALLDYLHLSPFTILFFAGCLGAVVFLVSCFLMLKWGQKEYPVVLPPGSSLVPGNNAATIKEGAKEEKKDISEKV